MQKMHTLACMENMVIIVFSTWMRIRRTSIILRACTSCVIGLDPGHANILAIARTDRDTIIPTTYVLPNKYSLISFEWKSEKHDMKCTYMKCTL